MSSSDARFPQPTHRREFLEGALFTAAAGLLGCATAHPGPAAATNSRSRPSSVHAGRHRWLEAETELLASKLLQRDVRISIARVPGGAGGAKPVIVYLLDPSFNFSQAVATTSFLSNFARLAGGRWPEIVIAGIGYDTDEPQEVFTRRAFDLTPTPSGVPPELPLPPLKFGGAATFLSALRDEIVPFVEQRVNASAWQRVLVGHSFGGLFALYTVFHEPASFDGYLAISPSVWWDDRITMRYERTRADTSGDLPVRLFLAVGDGEQTPGTGWLNEGFPDEALRKVRQVDNFRDLVATLESRNYAALRMKAAMIPDEYHLTIFPSAFAKGLRWMVEQL